MSSTNSMSTSALNHTPPTPADLSSRGASASHPLPSSSRVEMTETTDSAASISRKNLTGEKQMLRDILSTAMPLFLPAEYHQMRCKFPETTENYEVLIKEQWDAAFCFVYSSSVFGPSYMDTTFQQLHTNCILPVTAISLASSPAELCQNAAEFLLEPWVLIQIPFQPALLHQWAVALLAEAMTFQKKISAIFSLGCPEKLATISENLRKMLLTMKSCANFMLKIYVKMCLQAKEMNINAILYTKIKELSNHLIKVMPIIEFVTNKEVNSFLYAIEEMFLKELNAGGEANPPEVVILNEEPAPLYDFWFWTTECKLSDVITGASNDSYKGSSVLLRGMTDADHVCNPQCPCCPSLRKKIRTLSENWLQSKRLGGVHIEEIMAGVEKYLTTDIQLHFEKAKHFTESNNAYKLKNDRRVGVISHMICLYSEVKEAEFFHLLARRIFDIVKKVNVAVTIGNSVIRGATPDYSLSDIESELENIFANTEWTWEKILADAKSFFSSLEEIYPSDIDKHPAKVIQHYQTKIRKLVHTMAKKHLTSIRAGRFEFAPEQQFVQYLLPCFVNCFLGPLADPSKSQTAAKRKCVRFVEKLICSYEHQEYSQVLSAEKKVSIQDRDVQFNDVSNCTQFMVKIFSEFSTNKAFLRTIDYFFKSVRYEFINREINQSISGSVESSSWFIQLDMFLLRAVSILKDVSNIQDEWQSKALSVCSSIYKALRILDDTAISIYAVYKNSLIKTSDRLKTKETCQILKDLLSKMPKDVLDCAKKLSCQQLASLFVFLQFRSHRAVQLFKLWKSQLQGPGFPFDPMSVLIWSAAASDVWKIKQLVAPMLMIKVRRGKTTHDTSLVSLDFAKSNVCYKPVLKMISPDGTKVLMKEKGEITLVPVKHCRWCGLIKVAKFRLCSMCQEFSSDYCDVNYFCSEECETDALKSKHREEHARLYEEKLGFKRHC